MRSLTLVRADQAKVLQRTALLVGTAVAWAGLCAMVVQTVAAGYGYSTTWLSTGNAWIALMTLPALIAFSSGDGYREQSKWFFWLLLALAPSQATALIFAIAWT